MLDILKETDFWEWLGLLAVIAVQVLLYFALKLCFRFCRRADKLSVGGNR